MNLACLGSCVLWIFLYLHFWRINDKNDDNDDNNNDDGDGDSYVGDNTWWQSIKIIGCVYEKTVDDRKV